MKILRCEYRNLNKLIYRYKKGDNLEFFEKNDLFIREKNNHLILKIKIRKQYLFKRILFKNIIDNKFWFGKYSDNEDLFFIKKTEKRILIFVLKDQRKYESILVDMIKSNPSILYNKIV